MGEPRALEGTRAMLLEGDEMGGGGRSDPLGSVSIEDDHDLDIGARRPIHVWRPGPALEGKLPQGFRLDLACFVVRGGERRFWPAKGPEAFLIEASLGGMALLDHLRDLGPEDRFSYNAMRLVFEQAPKLREHLGRSFRRESDLRVAHPDSDVLPDRLGLDRRGNGRRWSVAELLSRGREGLSSAGEPGAGERRAIAEGLLAGARLDPIGPGSLTVAEARALVRMALFDLDPGDGPLDPGIKDRVTERFLAALDGHLDDDTKGFNRWFLDGRDDIIHRIAAQRKKGGPIPRVEVRRALLELAWDSFAYVGSCVALQMQAFARCLAEPLRPAERPAYEAWYASQAYLGDLPMVMLHARFDFLREAITGLVDDPADPVRIGALLRLLDLKQA